MDDSSVNPEIERLAHQVIGAAIEVRRTLGPGFLESSYEAALAIEFELHSIPCERQPRIKVMYKNRVVGRKRLDFLVGHHLVVELKAVETLLPVHTAQVLSYLRATHNPLGLLINFNVPVLKQGIRRIILT
jgi:GxxExxY protein